MSTKPPQYFVEYWDLERVAAARAKLGNDFDPADVTVQKNFETLAAARRFAATARSRMQWPRLCERCNLRNVTEEDDFPAFGQLWEWDVVTLEEP